MPLIILLLFFGFGIQAEAASDKELFNKFYKDAVHAEKRGDEDAAIHHYAQAYKYDKRDSALLAKLGLIYMDKNFSSDEEKLENYQKAYSYLKRAHDLESGDSMITLLTAKAAKSIGNLDESLALLKKAVKLEPDNVLITFDLALIYFQEKNFKEAIELFNRIILAYPDHLKARSYLGAALQSTDNYLAAIEQYKYVLDYQVNNYAVHKNMADCWLALKEYDRARAAYEKAAEIDPNVPHIYADLAFLDSRAGDYESAVTNYQNAIRLKNETVWHQALAKVFYFNGSKKAAIDAYLYAEDYNMAAFIMQEQGDLDSAIKNYNLALAKNPEDSKSIYNLARIYFEQKEYELAKAQFEKLLQLKPNDFESLFMLASVEHALEKYDTAIQYYNEILDNSEKISPEFKNDVYYNLALAQKSHGELEKSEENLEKILSSEEKYLAEFKKLDDLYRNLLAVKLDLDKMTEAEKLLKDILNDKPTDLRLRQVYVDLLIETERYKEAEEQLRIAVAVDKTQKSRLKLANLFKLNQNNFDALSEYQSVIQKEPRNLEAILGAANTFKALSLNKEAENYYARALEYYPDDYLANYNFGLLLQSEKKYKEALTYHEKVLKLNPDFLENYYVLGLCYWNLEDKDKAIKLWNEFLAVSEDEETKENIQKLIQSQAELPPKSLDLKLPGEDERPGIEVIESDVPYYDQLNLV